MRFFEIEIGNFTVIEIETEIEISKFRKIDSLRSLRFEIETEIEIEISKFWIEIGLRLRSRNFAPRSRFFFIF